MSEVLARLGISEEQYIKLVTDGRRRVLEELPTPLQDIDALPSSGRSPEA